MSIYWLCASISSLLLILEVLLGAQFFLFFLSAAGFFSAAIGYQLEMNINQMLIIFSITSLSLLILWTLFYKNRWKHKTQGINHVLIELKGTTAPLLGTTHKGLGKVKIRHTLWSVKLIDPSQELPKDSLVEVVDLEGMTLIVKGV